MASLPVSPLVSPLHSSVSTPGALSPFSFARRGPSNSSSTPGSAANRSAWTITEDAAILDGVHKEGTKNWAVIAQAVTLVSRSGNERTGKQCRERFHNHLDPNISKRPWSKEEEKIIVDMQAKIGNRWAVIAKKLPGRTDNNVKNRWYSTLHRKRKASGSMDESGSGSAEDVEEETDNSPSMSGLTTPGTSGKTSPTKHHRPVGDPGPSYTTPLSSISNNQHSAHLEQLKLIITGFPEIQHYFGYTPEELNFVVPEAVYQMLGHAKLMADNEIKKKLITDSRLSGNVVSSHVVASEVKSGSPLHLAPLVIPTKNIHPSPPHVAPAPMVVEGSKDVTSLKINIGGKLAEPVVNSKPLVKKYNIDPTPMNRGTSMDGFLPNGLDDFSKAFSPAGGFSFTPNFNDLFNSSSVSPQSNKHNPGAVMTPRGLEEFAKGLDDFLGGTDTPRTSNAITQSLESFNTTGKDFDFFSSMDHRGGDDLSSSNIGKRKRSFGNIFDTPNGANTFNTPVSHALGRNNFGEFIESPAMFTAPPRVVSNKPAWINNKTVPGVSHGDIPSPPKKARKEEGGEATVPRVQQEILIPIFAAFDTDRDGYITFPEFEKLIQLHSSEPSIKPQVFSDGNHASLQLKEIFALPDGTMNGRMSYASFTKMYQTCLRCTENKRKKMKGGDPVLVRHIPIEYEGDRVKGCDHYAWTFCKGWDVTHNEKCKGSNRHEPCPKYLANCTLWKHKLPPKVSTKNNGGASADALGGAGSDTSSFSPMSGMNSAPSSPFRLPPHSSVNPTMRMVTSSVPTTSWT